MLRPFFPYYGSKWRAVPRYPPPLSGHAIVEPFAGSAGYATRHNAAMVLLVDRDPVIVGIWRYLLRVTATEVRRLPDVPVGGTLEGWRGPQEARWLIGFWLNRGSATPKVRRSLFSSDTGGSQFVWGPDARERIARQLDAIRHWHVVEGDYSDPPDAPATWFVDPPYTEKGRHYRCRDIDYPTLGAWCRTRRGRVIVCEAAGAAWLPFVPLGALKATRGTSDEVFWHRDR